MWENIPNVVYYFWKIRISLNDKTVTLDPFTLWKYVLTSWLPLYYETLPKIHCVLRSSTLRVLNGSHHCHLWSTVAFKNRQWNKKTGKQVVKEKMRTICNKHFVIVLNQWKHFFMRCRETIYNSTSGKHSHYYTQSREHWSQRFHKKRRKCRTKFSTPHSLKMIYLFYAENFIRFTYFLVQREAQFPYLTKLYRMIFLKLYNFVFYYLLLKYHFALHSGFLNFCVFSIDAWIIATIPYISINLAEEAN